MKLESLKSSKFEAFKEDVLKNPLMVTGGAVSKTTYTYTSGTPGGTDTWRTGPDLLHGSTGSFNTTWQESGELVNDFPTGPGDIIAYDELYEQPAEFTLQ